MSKASGRATVVYDYYPVHVRSRGKVTMLVMGIGVGSRGARGAVAPLDF